MFNILLIAHSMFRWLVLAALCYTLYRSWCRYRTLQPFTKTDNALRHWSATIAHIQLMLGMVLYTQSPMVKYFNSGVGDNAGEPVFFGVIHILLMLLAIVVVTIGSARAKRQPTDSRKFKTIYTFFGIALLVILVAIPWPFSTLAHRPLIRF
ncbi:hypothetical protein AM493_18185 [Flavobacterium akiainvivens]|uniref:Cytochrome B n=1 Tax=Flavobacterium akiainvivens TaxID=1202724 RepID=A0A0M8MFE2_9FLAO|nr:hypothetical protein [Flavobacterium akiainvivens]KOS07764.1 hypothetical protein AM493_18185 [Flavobacterium akiainvivens]SFQ25851.1 hypothetical protein SAMN05444144_102218 [Flavobacterium akiainvivens]